LSKSLSVRLGATILLSLVSTVVVAQDDRCSLPPAALLSPSNAAYSDALEFANLLRDHGFVVRCMFPTKLGSIFELEEGGMLRSTVEGDANFVTNFGEVEVVFLPKGQSFANFKIKEHREGNGYLYTFAGTPRVWDVNRFGTARRVHFLKHQNHLLYVGEDKALLARLNEALHLERSPR
jgi:hypothetical protein